MRHFWIIGAGTGTRDSLTGQAWAQLQRTKHVFAPPRLAASFADLPQMISCPYQQLASRAQQQQEAAILVSGDTGFYSAAHKLYEALSPYGEVTLLCGLSSLQYFCAKLGTGYEDIYTMSLHGRQGSILGAVSHHKRVFALTGGEITAQAVCGELTQAGLGDCSIHIGENLGAPQERILSGTAQALAQQTFDSLAVVLAENSHAVNPFAPLPDSAFIRGKTPMSKEEVRWVSLHKLAVQPQDIVYDIGAGTGAMTMTLARAAYLGQVYAIERDEAALALLAENRKKLGGYHVRIIAGHAPQALEALPAPDAVFIGGSGGNLQQVLELILRKNPKVRVVVNAVTLETLAQAATLLQMLDFANVEVVQIAAARGKKAGSYTLMTANNPVYILSGGTI